MHDRFWFYYRVGGRIPFMDTLDDLKTLTYLHNLLKLTVLQNKSRKFNEWLFDPDHYAGGWHKKNMLRDFQDL